MHSRRKRARLVIAPPEPAVPFVFSCRRVGLQTLGVHGVGDGSAKGSGSNRTEEGNKSGETIVINTVPYPEIPAKRTD